MAISEQNITNEDDLFSENFTSREYQVEIFETALKKNTIALLGTGTGKTFIGVMLIRELSYQVEKPFSQGGKRTIFLVPTVPLAIQQSQTLELHTHLKVDCFHGSKGTDNWSIDQWTAEFEKNQVLVMTAEVFKIILHHGFIGLSRINLIVFDECHKAVKNHPYREIMKCFLTCPVENQPRILGLTASLVNGSINARNLEAEIKTLEVTLNSTVMTASDLGSLKKYGTDPIEQIVLYEDFSVAQNRTLSCIEALLSNAHSLISSADYTFSIDEEEMDTVYLTNPKKCLNAVKNILTSLGPSCTRFAIRIFKEEINNMLPYIAEEEEKVALESTLKCLEVVEAAFELYFKSSNSVLSSKLNKLLQILRRFKNGVEVGDDGKEDMCCIIFVEQRITAYVLHAWLNQISSNNPQDFGFIQSRFIVGHGWMPSLLSRMSKMNIANQTKVLKEFKDEKFNILIATSVIEEGMDVRKCNLVIRFDPPRDFRAYVQSKGRARAKQAYYVMLISESESPHFMKEAINFKKIEKVLTNNCHDRTFPMEEEVLNQLNNDLIPPYMTDHTDGRPRLSAHSAISLVNRYCSLLSPEKSVVMSPSWNIHTFMDGKAQISRFQCTLLLPMNCPLKHAIKGRVMPNKKYAKMAAALLACIELSQEGELDDHFIPVGVKVTEKDKEFIGVEDELEVVDPDAPQPGSNKRRQIYTKKISKELSFGKIQPDSQCFLYKIEMRFEKPRHEISSSECPMQSEYSVGLVMYVEMTRMPEISIFSPFGEVKVKFTPLNFETKLNQNQIQLVQDFNKIIYGQMGFFNPLIQYDVENAGSKILILPLHSDGICWELIDSAIKDHESPREAPKYSLNSPFVFDKKIFENAVIYPFYKSRKELNFIKSIPDEITPLSPFPKISYANFSEYYKAKYSVEISNLTQNLIEAKRFRHMSLVSSVLNNKSAVLKPILDRKLLVPELCKVHPIPACLWKQILCLPSSFYRLNSLLLSQSLRLDVGSYFGLTDLDPALETSLDLDLECDALNSMFVYPQSPAPVKEGEIRKVLFDSYPSHPNTFPPSPVLILKALTSASAGDVFNLERLETMGDSFLKYLMTLLVYKRYNTDEGRLHTMRSRLICNKKLYQVGKKRGIPLLMQTLKFEAGVNWVPPGYSVSADNESSVYTSQEISDKSVADAVEALVGVFLLSCGPLGAIRFLSYLGFEICEKETCLEGGPIIQELPPPTLYVDGQEEAKSNLGKLSAGMDNFEHAIGYTFKNKAYLVQAFTHPSYLNNRVTGCYQRLEFLGDAILDYIITSVIFRDGHTPGQLTDLRTALVCNSFFTFMAAKHDYYRYLKIQSSGLFRDIKQYIDLRKPDSSLSEEEQLQQYLYQEFDEFSIDSPKALGDVFESVAGAIYLDSGMSLDTVWRVYYPMMRHAIKMFSKDVPVNIVKRAVDAFPQAKFLYKGTTGDDKQHEVELAVPGVGTFHARGHNKTMAKRVAAKKLLNTLSQTERNLNTLTQTEQNLNTLSQTEQNLNTLSQTEQNLNTLTQTEQNLN